MNLINRIFMQLSKGFFEKHSRSKKYQKTSSSLKEKNDLIMETEGKLRFANTTDNTAKQLYKMQ